MPDSTLSTPHFIGRDKFVWWIGQVEKSVDTAKNSNRVKVRIVGYHSDRTAVPSEELPWANILMPPTNAQSGGTGKKAMLTPGQWVVGFFLDGDEAQVPCIWGCLGGTIGTDTDATVPQNSYQSPQNIWSKPEMTTPSSVAKKASNPSSDSTNQMPHMAGSNKPAAQGSTEGSEDDFEKVDSSETKPKVLTEDPLASTGQVAKEQEQTYEVAVADGVCGANSVMDQMSSKLTEFIEDVSSATKVGELWINTQTGAVMDMTQKIQSYSTLIGNMLQAPMSAIMRFAEAEAKKLFPAIFAAAAAPDPFGLSGVKETVDKVLSAIKCAFNSDILSGLGDLVSGILGDIVGGVGDAISGLFTNVVNAADCILQSALEKTLGSIMSGLSTVMDGVSSALASIGGTIEQITGAVSSVMGFAQQILGILDCINPDSNKCARTKVYSTKEGSKRPKPFFDMNNPDLDKALSDLAGAPLNVCEDAQKPTSNSQEIFPSAVGATVSQTITGLGGGVGTILSAFGGNSLGGTGAGQRPIQTSAVEEVGEFFEGYIPIEAIQSFQDGGLDISVALAASGIQDPTRALAFATSVESAISSGFGDPTQAYQAAQALGDSGILFQFTESHCVGPAYGIFGKLTAYNPDTGAYIIEGLDAPLIPGTWMRSSSGHCVQIGSTSIYKPKAPGKGRGARVILPVDEDGCPKTDAIVLDGGSGYGNGKNGNHAPDAFVVTEMYDHETGQPVEGYYLKGTVFVDDNGSITAVTFNNEFNYCFRDIPQVSINGDGGDLGDPTENDAVKDPNTLTNQTNTTLVLNTANTAINGILQDFHITNVGFGYKNPVITITGGGGSGATAEVVDYYGRIVDIKITNSGSGYTSVPNIFIKDEPILGEDPNTFRGTGARVYPVIRYLSSSNPSLVKKLAGAEIVEVVDCP